MPVHRRTASRSSSASTISPAGREARQQGRALRDAARQAPWRATAGKPSLRWVTIAMNGMLARAPYDKATSRVREAIVKELPDDDGACGVDRRGVARRRRSCSRASARPVGLAASLGARERRPDRPESPGARAEGRRVRRRRRHRHPHRGLRLDRHAARARAERRPRCSPPRPTATASTCSTAPTAYVTPPKRTYDSATTEPEERLDRVSLVDQLFVARLVQFLRALCSKLPSKSDPAEVAARRCEAAVWALFDGARPARSSSPSRRRGRVRGHGRLGRPSSRAVSWACGLDEMSLDMPLG